jgi:hypothetical protein
MMGRFRLWKKGDTGRFLMFLKTPEGTRKTATTWFEVPEDPNVSIVSHSMIEL